MEADSKAVDQEVREVIFAQTSFDFVKMHYLTWHFLDHITEYGNIQTFAAELMEGSHKPLKDGYRASNKVNATQQILTYTSRHSNFDLFDLHREHQQAQIGDRLMADPLPRRLQGRLRARTASERILSVSDMARSYGFELSDVDGWIQSFLNVYHNEVYRELLQLDKLRRIPLWPCDVFNSLSLGRLRFGSADEEVKLVVRCTGPRAWRKEFSPREDCIYLWTGDARLFGDLKGHLPARLLALFKLKDAQGRSYRCAVVHTFEPLTAQAGKPAGTAHTDTGLISVGIRKNPPRTGRSPGCIYIVPIKRIMFPAHLIRFDPGEDNTGFFVNNTIDLSTWNEVYAEELDECDL